jgi:two-component system, chemotaxis family, CheB/CheR fusion protein
MAKKTEAPMEGEKENVPIVAIGASAGGLEAVSELLRHLSPVTGMAYVYVQHLGPSHESRLSSILGKVTPMAVREAEPEMPLRPNEVYIVPPNKDMEVVDGIFILRPRNEEPFMHTPIDCFFISLSESQKEGAIAVLLSGTGTDGTLGLKAIKRSGGLTFAQDETARFHSMPMAAIGEGVVDMVMAPGDIAREIERLSQNTLIFQQTDEMNPVNEEDVNIDLRLILQLLLKSTGVDFSHYKMNTIQRRINRRIVLYRLESLREYAKYMLEHPLEIGLLYNDLLINVTQFFRDPETTILPALQKSQRGIDLERTEGVRRQGFTLKETAVDSNDLEKAVDALLLTRYVPAGVLVNQDLDILQFRGSTGLFLEPSSGKDNLNLLKIAPPDLVFELRSLVHKVKKTGKTAQKKGLELNVKGTVHQVEVEVVPLRNDAEELLVLIIFRETPLADVSLRPSVVRDRRIRQLEEELALVREDMRSIIEDQEANIEELQSVNKEIVSSNEELQSINEELETSKQKIESTNEELITINQELQERNDQLSEAQEYAKLIFGAIREATLILDRNLRIRSANSAFYRTFHVKPESTEGLLIYELGERGWDIPELRHLLDKIIPQKGHFENFEVRHTFPGIGERVMLLNAEMVMQQPYRQEMILLVIEDITEYRQVQRLLEEREAWFHGMADLAPVLIRVVGIDGLCNFLNKTWLQFSGRNMDEETGHGWAERIHPDDWESYQQLYNAHFHNRQPYRTEYRLMRHDGEHRWMLENGKPLFSINGEFNGFMCTCAEVHDQKRENELLEARVAQRTQALYQANTNLKRSNEELRQYAYIASHDLQEPLRKIVTFSGRIQKKFADSLPEQGHEYLTKIVTSAQRMTRLIDDLLTFSRTIHQNNKFATVDLNATLEEILQDFDLTIAEKQATLQVGHLPVIEAVPLQMAQLFYNLIGNALKFTSSDKPPVISIEAQEADWEEVSRRIPQAERGLYWKVAVSDNGIGFDPSFAEQIFSIFQRLHDRNTYMGTGIGLALCRRIINNHGGDLYAEGKEGEGAIFHLLLPAKQNEQERKFLEI